MATLTEVADLLTQIRDLLARMEARAESQYEGSPSDEAISAAVCAELARNRIPKARLEDVLGVSRPTLYAKTNGHYPFSVKELGDVAAFLNTTAIELMHSALVHESRQSVSLQHVDVHSGLEEDIWAAPGRSRSAATSYPKGAQSAESPQKRQSKT